MAKERLPPGMSPRIARKFEKQISRGKTIRDLVLNKSKFFLVAETRFKKHCELHSAWAQNILKLGKVSLGKKRKATSGHGNATKIWCLRGLHRMTPDNVLIDGVGHRRCKACRYISMPGNPMTAEMVEQIRGAIINGASFGEILHGRPTGGGKIDRSLVITTVAKFQRQRDIDPGFDAFVTKYLAAGTSVGQVLRFARERGSPPELERTLIGVARLKHRIKTLRHGSGGDE